MKAKVLAVGVATPKSSVTSAGPLGAGVMATWGLVLIREGNYSEGKKFYERAHQCAPEPQKRRLKKKMLIEDARKAIADGKPKHAHGYLDRALKFGTDPELDAEARGLRANTFRQ